MMEFTFEETPWELTLRNLNAGDSLSAARFLTLMEGEEEVALENAFLDMEERGIALDITDLPRSVATGEAAVRLRREEQLVSQADFKTALEENDSLRLYLEELAAIPACGDSAILARESAAGNENARNKLADLMLSRVTDRAREYVGYGVLLLDLIQEGGMGMWQGILNWNGDGDFEAHADWWIRQSMAKLITLQARSSGVGQKMRQALEDYRQVDERLLSELGRNPTLEEIAEQLHMTPEAAASVREMLSSARLMERAKGTAQQEEAPEEEEAHVEDTALFQMRQRIADLLSDLDAQDQRLLTLRFGLEGGLPLTPEETGRKLGLTPEEVITREGNALAQLRKS